MKATPVLGALAAIAGVFFASLIVFIGALFFSALFLGILFPLLHFAFGITLDASLDAIRNTLVYAICTSAVILLQVFGWHKAREELSTSVNSVILIIFAVYASAAFGVLRNALQNEMPGSYSVETEIKDRFRELEIHQLESSREESAVDLRQLQDAMTELTIPTCMPIYLVSWGEHFMTNVQEELRKRDSKVKPGRPQCRIVILRHSGVPQIAVDIAFRRPHPDDRTFVFILQHTPDFPRYRLFMEKSGHEVKWLPGMHDVSGRGSLMDVLAKAYTNPREANLFRALLEMRLSWELTHQNEINRQIDDLYARQIEPRVPLTEFVIITVGQFLEAFDDLIVPVTLRAQLLDLVFHLFRFLFAVVYLESLARGRNDSEPTATIPTTPSEQQRGTTRHKNSKEERNPGKGGSYDDDAGRHD
jgi:hypothetical protein